MFTRRVVFQIKADSSAEFTRITRGDVLPLLRAQAGCRHEETFITPELSEAVVNSYWDTEEHAEAYDRSAYQESLKALAGVLEGVPRVESFYVSSATVHAVTAPRREAYRAAHYGKASAG
jgi:hypothetical protein